MTTLFLLAAYAILPVLLLAVPLVVAERGKIWPWVLWTGGTAFAIWRLATFPENASHMEKATTPAYLKYLIFAFAIAFAVRITRHFWEQIDPNSVLLRWVFCLPVLILPILVPILYFLLRESLS